MRKRLSKPEHKDALAKEIRRRKAVNQAKDDLNASREQTFLSVDPFTETVNDKIAPIMREIRVEGYKFHDAELTMDEVKTARNRLEREVISATPGKVDNDPLPEDADILRKMRRMPLLIKWKDELSTVIAAFEKWQRNAESAITLMCSEPNDTVGYNDTHCEKLRKSYATLKPLAKQLTTIRCAETDAAWFESVMACMAWLNELYVGCYVESRAVAPAPVPAPGSKGTDVAGLPSTEIDEAIVAKFQSTLKKFKNVRNALQASVVISDSSVWFPFFTAFLDKHGNYAKDMDDQMGEWGRRARKALIAPSGDFTLGALEGLLAEAQENFPFRTSLLIAFIACIYCLYLLPLFAAVFAVITPPDEHYLTSSSSSHLSKVLIVYTS